MARNGASTVGRSLWCVLGALLLAPSGCAAIDFSQAWQAALRNDPQWRAARATAQAARERVPQAAAPLRPQVTASVNRSRNDLHTEQAGIGGVPLSEHDRYGSGSDVLSIRQPLYRPQLTSQYRQAEALVAASEATLQSEEQRLLMRLAQAYAEALLAQEQVTLVALQRTAFAAQLDAARRAISGGSGTRTDIDEAQARLDLNLAQELEARQAVELARRQLSVLLGEPVAELSPLAPERLPPPEQASSAEGWVARAEEGNPELRAARAQLDAARQEVERARTAHHPTLDAVAQVARSQSDNPTRVDTSFRHRALGLQLTVPLYEGGATQSRVRQALAEAERAESLVESVRIDLGARVYGEFRGVTEGAARIRALEQAVRSSEQLVVSSRRSQAAGVRTVLDILNAEQQLGAARRDLARARFAYVLAMVRLRALAGEPAQASVDQANDWLRRGAS